MITTGGDTGGDATPPYNERPELDHCSVTPSLDFAEVMSFFLPPALYQRYARIIDDVGSLAGITLDDACGLFVCQLWTMDPALIAQVARWFGVRTSDVTRCRDRVLDNWADWENAWDIDSHSRLMANNGAVPTAPSRLTFFARMARQCRYAVWVPAFPGGSAFVAAIATRHRLGGANVTPRCATALARQIVERLEEFHLNGLIAADVQDLLRAFYRRHIPGRRRANALAEEALTALEDSLQDGGSEDRGALWSRRFPEWVHSVALRVLLSGCQPGEGVESPEAILDRLRPNLVDVAASGPPVRADPVDQSANAVQRNAGNCDGGRVNKRRGATAMRIIEQRVFLPAGLKPVASYGDRTLMTAARHGRLAAVRFLRHWYTTDRAVGDYLPKQEPRSIMKHGFRAAATLSPYVYFIAMNRYNHLLVRESNRVFIHEELWRRLKKDLDRPIEGPDILMRFATSQYDYRLLLAAAKSGQLGALYDRHRRAWVTTREEVEAYRSSERLAHRRGPSK